MAASRSGGSVTAITRVTGDFPVSPLMFAFRFTGGGDDLTTISELTITPRP